MVMKTSDYITSVINRFPNGYVFTYADFMRDVNQREAVIKALNRLAGSEKIAKLSKGRYYKPETTVFGTLEPDVNQVVKDLLENKGKVTGYLTGYAIYNRLGLTTQVSNAMQIARKQMRPPLNRGRYSISFVLQKNTITKQNIPLLQLLDALRNIKKIPDTDILSACKRFLAIFKSLSEEDKNSLVRLSLKYPPFVRALLGALLDQIKENRWTRPLQKTLNPITKYKLPQVNHFLDKATKWNIT